MKVEIRGPQLKAGESAEDIWGLVLGQDEKVSILWEI